MVNTLLLTGQNNHDWQRSAPFVRDLLEGTSRFSVTTSTDPSTTLEDSTALAQFQLLFLDYNGPMWSDAARANFEKAVADGTGLVVLHAADNAFAGWVEYEKMVGLLWREGASHGEFHEFPVTITDRDHPITRGIDDFKTWDELYHNLSHMHGVDCHVLATAFSATEMGGSGKDEPMMVTTQYGRGRVYHHVLGHVWEGDPNGEYKGASMIALEHPAFQQTLIRGCEWAATGGVSTGSQD